LVLPNNSKVEHLLQRFYGLQGQTFLLLGLYRKNLQTLALFLHEFTEVTKCPQKKCLLTPWLKLEKEKCSEYSSMENGLLDEEPTSQFLQQTP
jgi:hypothetical protein